MKNLDEQLSSLRREYLDCPPKKRREYSIPIDLLIDIFLRVPAKSIARFRCVSKFWASILGQQDFTELFLTRFSTRPRLLFTFHYHGKLYFYSAPQPHNPDENSSIVATRYHNFSLRIRDASFQMCSPLCGLVSPHGLQDGRKYPVTVICNPVTGESINLPNVDITGRSFLGYDPIDKQCKVLFCSQHIMCDEHRVLTLETGKHLWRMIKCKPHRPNVRSWNMICITGFLYYRAKASFEGSSVIVCFDVRYEKFHFINMDKGMELHPSCTLINYNGKLGALQYTHWLKIINLELWVLDDVGHKWSKHVYVLPPLYIQIIKETMLHIVGMTGRGEVVLSHHYYRGGSFCVFYYNLERNTLIKVGIQGLEESKDHFVYTFLDYLENVKLM